MAELARRSPLALVEMSSIPGPEPVTLVELPFQGKLIVRAGVEAREPASAVLGLELPRLLRTASAADVTALGLGPDEWLLLTAADRAESLAAALRQACGPAHHAVVVVSDRMAGIGIAGARAQDTLCAGCPIDLQPLAFPAEAVTRTLLGKAPIVLLRPTAEPRYAIWVNGSFAPYVWRFLENAALEHGVAVES